MKKKSRRDSAAARRDILAAALKVFARHGYHGGTTRRIARLSGLNEALIFRYFGSKKGLLESLIEQNRLSALLPPFDKPHEYSLVEFLEHTARGAFEAYEDNPDFFRLLRFTLIEDASLFAEYFRFFDRYRVRPLIAFLQQAAAKGLIRSDVPAESHAGTFAALLSSMVEWRILGLNPEIGRLSRKECVRRVVDTFLQGANPLAVRLPPHR